MYEHYVERAGACVEERTAAQVHPGVSVQHPGVSVQYSGAVDDDVSDGLGAAARGGWGFQGRLVEGSGTACFGHNPAVMSASVNILVVRLYH
jgi:large exoprotein involved in heme utilization and adhesion